MKVRNDDKVGQTSRLYRVSGEEQSLDVLHQDTIISPSPRHDWRDMVDTHEHAGAIICLIVLVIIIVAFVLLMRLMPM